MPLPVRRPPVLGVAGEACLHAPVLNDLPMGAGKVRAVIRRRVTAVAGPGVCGLGRGKDRSIPTPAQRTDLAEERRPIVAGRAVAPEQLRAMRFRCRVGDWARVAGARQEPHFGGVAGLALLFRQCVEVAEVAEHHSPRIVASFCRKPDDLVVRRRALGPNFFPSSLRRGEYPGFQRSTGRRIALARIVCPLAWTVCAPESTCVTQPFRFESADADPPSKATAGIRPQIRTPFLPMIAPYPLAATRRIATVT